MISVKRISHATFETPDLDRQIDYFTEIAGLRLAARENGRAFLATKVGDLAVQLEKGDAARCARLAFQVAPDTEFDDIRRGIEAEGLRCQTRNDPSPGISRMLAFEDPKGTVCEVFAAQMPIARKTEVRGIGPLKLGHLAFVVTDPRAFADFYGRVLGFRVSDWIEDWFVFMRCGPDHHTVNFVQGKRTQMHHIAFELKDWAHIQAACDFLGSRNIPIIWGPGRHGPGNNLFIFIEDPDGNWIEVSAELEVVHDRPVKHWPHEERTVNLWGKGLLRA
jgi:catechol 2,3-dioxygenase-like lactoylglutathione lyase family enzyme